MKILDVARLVQAIKEVAVEIREAKAPLRTRWERGMGLEQYQLLMLKRRATTLCALRAASRGRRHPIKLDEAAYEAFIASARTEFEVEVVPPEDRPPSLKVGGFVDFVDVSVGFREKLSQAFTRVFKPA